MRIIAGKYRSRKLNTLPGLKTRPTLDKTKEAIFSSLGGYLTDFVVLDVFGGSGALSLESLSRGAKKAYIIDSNIEAINIIKTNAANLKVKDKTIKMFKKCYAKRKQVEKWCYITYAKIKNFCSSKTPLKG